MIKISNAVIEEEFFAFDENQWQKQVLVIVNVRLGFETINEEYFSSLLACTKLPHFMGIFGGKPRKAFYFVGAHHKS